MVPSAGPLATEPFRAHRASDEIDASSRWRRVRSKAPSAPSRGRRDSMRIEARIHRVAGPFPHARRALARRVILDETPENITSASAPRRRCSPRCAGPSCISRTRVFPDRSTYRLKGQCRPGQPECSRHPEQPRKAPYSELPIMRPALLDQPMGFGRGQRCPALRRRRHSRAPRVVPTATYLIAVVTLRTRAITLFAIAGVDCASNTSNLVPTMIAEFGSPSAGNA